MNRDFFQELYDSNSEYVERRDPGSLSARQIAMETQLFKAPNLFAVLPPDCDYRSVIEIGCGTGELLAAFPAGHAGTQLRRVGFDISPLNVAAARERFPGIDFRSGDFRPSDERADIVILSDVLEHVPDDAAFLGAAARMGRITLINLPLEDNWLNRNRRYGPEDSSGHLRRYSLADGQHLIERAGLKVLLWRQVWSHETHYDVERRALRKAVEGMAHAGPVPVRAFKAMVHAMARACPPLGRTLYPSNMFASAVSGQPTSH